MKEAIEKSRSLVERSGIALVGSIGSDSFPNIKAMINAKYNDLKEIWFSTNTSSKRVNQFKMNDKSCVYFVDFETWEGLMLVGRIEIKRDSESRKMLWNDDCEKYYPLGADDPDYTVLHFVAQYGNYYKSPINVNFLIPESLD
ncbi:MAG: pyridoxamine 5'-phosphate oxidase family protein [Asgard group archaeon]|nr:pyridoxamine 5'-phosphate oxidase family protein [Asgard group archaeon]